MTTIDTPAPSLFDATWRIGFDGQGGALHLPPAAAGSASAIGRGTWLHIASGDAARALLPELGELPPKVVEYFTRPAEQARLVAVGGGLLMSLRGVEQPLAAGVQSVGLHSIQLWIGQDCVVTAASPVPAAIREIHKDLLAGVGPSGPVAFLGRLAFVLIRDLGPLLDDRSGALDLLETRVLTRDLDHHPSRELNRIRLDLLRLHRHLSPQRTLLHGLLQERGRYRLGMGDVPEALREASERVDDRLDRLDGLRDHCGALQEALAELQSQRMNDALYLLSLYTALFLPMGVLTGLLGINVAGIPGEKNPWAFWLVCLVLLLLGAAGYMVFKKIGLTQPVTRKGPRVHLRSRKQRNRGSEAPTKQATTTPGAQV